MSERTVRAVVAERFPGRSLAAVEPLTDGNRKWTAVVRFADGEPLVVHCAPDPTPLRVSARLTRAIGRRTRVPVPAVHAVGVHDGTGYLVTSHCPGESLHTRFAALDRADQRRVAARFGAFLGALHSRFRFDGYGRLRLASTPSPKLAAGLVPATRDWSQWLREYGRAAVGRLPPAFDPLRPRLRACLDAVPDDPPPARLFTWDLRPGNALVADGEVTAVVDWEGALAAAPALSVAKTEYLVADWYVDDPAPLRQAFREGYERVRPYPTVRPVHCVVAIAETAVDSTGRVTNPGYPEVDRAAAVEFHRDALRRALKA